MNFKGQTELARGSCACARCRFSAKPRPQLQSRWAAGWMWLKDPGSELSRDWRRSQLLRTGLHMRRICQNWVSQAPRGFVCLFVCLLAFYLLIYPEKDMLCSVVAYFGWVCKIRDAKYDEKPYKTLCALLHLIENVFLDAYMSGFVQDVWYWTFTLFNRLYNLPICSTGIFFVFWN